MESPNSKNNVIGPDEEKDNFSGGQLPSKQPAYVNAVQARKKFGADNRKPELHKILAEKHLDSIAYICKKYGYTLSIRETGALSIKRIMDGAKAKPHTILEKSIKESSLAKGYNDQAKAILNKLVALDLDGFVGHWDNNGKLIGIRVDGFQEANSNELNKLVIRDSSSSFAYIPLDLDIPGGDDAILDLKKIQNWKTFLYTGDYDLHEAYSSSNGQIVEASGEKVRFLNRLNQGIAKVNGKTTGNNIILGDESRVGEAKLEHGTVHMTGPYAMFQHGDQATYAMNQHLEAKNLEKTVATLINVVASESDEPLAWCRKGEWFVTKDKKEHREFRSYFKLRSPHTWDDEEVAKRSGETKKHTSFSEWRKTGVYNKGQGKRTERYK